MGESSITVTIDADSLNAYVARIESLEARVKALERTVDPDWVSECDCGNPRCPSPAPVHQ
ncbi:hypothetical protein LCGC14_1370000 [marine sediment metagenome]|uniref:Uncharacterized protein n=1 Tax=marine sediment metagenome TaxID=412755 RepID=A0A0F9KRL2_9ZZZZ